MRKPAENIYEFDSMSDYIKTLTDPDLLKKGRCTRNSSKTGNPSWYGTYNFDEAVTLATEGWTECANRLTKQLNFQIKKIEGDRTMKMFLSQVGYQPIVPLYLNGCPNNMMNMRMDVKKQKVITIVKSVGFRGTVTTKQIEEESIKTLMLVTMLERKGYRVNLYTLNGYYANGGNHYCRVKIKSASERLNISKIAFPLVHPSMLRRLNFRFREIVAKTDVGGSLYTKQDNMPAIKKGEIFIPSFMKMTVDQIKDISDIEQGKNFDEV